MGLNLLSFDSRRSASAFIFLLFAVNFSIVAQSIDSLTFKYTYGNHCGYLNSSKQKVFEDYYLPAQAEYIRKLESPFLIGRPIHKNWESRLGLLSSSKDTIIPLIFNDIKLLSAHFFLGHKPKEDHNFLFYKLYSTDDTIPVLPDSFKIVFPYRFESPIFKMKDSNDTVLIFSLNKSFTPNRESLLKLSIFDADTAQLFFGKSELEIYKAIPRIEEKTSLTFEEELRSKLVEALSGSRFRHDDSLQVWEIYKDWNTCDTLIARLHGVNEVAWEYFSPSDSMYYYICEDTAGLFGVKDQYDAIHVPFSETEFTAIAHIDSVTELIIIKPTSGLYGMINYTNNLVLPAIYKKIRDINLFNLHLFECQDTLDQYGVVNGKGKMIIPFRYYDISKWGNLVKLKEKEYYYYDVQRQEKSIFHLDGYECSFQSPIHGYYPVTIQNIELPNFPISNLSFVFDENGVFYLPPEIETPLRTFMKN